MLKLFNTLTRKMEVFEPCQPDKVRLYSCGPTVYDHAHIGNFRSFLLADLLKRYLRYLGFEVFHVMNITDIEDKILHRIRQEGVGLRDLTEKYTRAFFQDLDFLNVERADLYPKATDHVEEMIQMISNLLNKGLAYERNGSVYFSIAKFADYGRLARLDVSGMQDGVRVDTDEYGKDHVRDFVLWKCWVESDGEAYWDSPFGRGRPGWHIECSCMSMKYLGESFDIHTGGVDLIFPHHQNEIAQSEGMTGKPFVKMWVHNEMLKVKGEKMSKSRSNFFRLKEIARAPTDYGAYRYLLVTSHYRNTLNFTIESLEAAKNALHRLRRMRQRLKAIDAESSGEDFQEVVALARDGFIAHLDNDLNTPRAMAAVFELVGRVEKSLNQGSISGKGAIDVLGFLNEINQVLGIFYELEGEDSRKTELTPELAQLLRGREEARAMKDWQRADLLRDQLEAAGLVVKDTPEGTEWSWSD